MPAATETSVSYTHLLAVPLAQRRRGHQFDVVHQQAVSHVGLLQFLHLGRRNDDGLHIAVVQHINQRIIVGEHPDTRCV